jgi:hypothetical protein
MAGSRPLVGEQPAAKRQVLRRHSFLERERVDD